MKKAVNWVVFLQKIYIYFKQYNNSEVQISFVIIQTVELYVNLGEDV